MATLWIREYAYIREGRSLAGGDVAGGSGPLQVRAEPGTDQSPLSFTGTAGQSAAFGADTIYVTVIGSAAFHYLVGANPTATTNHFKVPADTPWDIGVKAGQKISAIAAA